MAPLMVGSSGVKELDRLAAISPGSTRYEGLRKLRHTCSLVLFSSICRLCGGRIGLYISYTHSHRRVVVKLCLSLVMRHLTQGLALYVCLFGHCKLLLHLVFEVFQLSLWLWLTMESTIRLCITAALCYILFRLIVFLCFWCREVRSLTVILLLYLDNSYLRLVMFSMILSSFTRWNTIEGLNDEKLTLAHQSWFP